MALDRRISYSIPRQMSPDLSDSRLADDLADAIGAGARYAQGVADDKERKRQQKQQIERQSFPGEIEDLLSRYETKDGFDYEGAIEAGQQLAARKNGEFNQADFMGRVEAQAVRRREQAKDRLEAERQQDERTLRLIDAEVRARRVGAGLPRFIRGAIERDGLDNVDPVAISREAADALFEQFPEVYSTTQARAVALRTLDHVAHSSYEGVLEQRDLERKAQVIESGFNDLVDTVSVGESLETIETQFATYRTQLRQEGMGAEFIRDQSRLFIDRVIDEALSSGNPALLERARRLNHGLPKHDQYDDTALGSKLRAAKRSIRADHQGKITTAIEQVVRNDPRPETISQAKELLEQGKGWWDMEQPEEQASHHGLEMMLDAALQGYYDDRRKELFGKINGYGVGINRGPSGSTTAAPGEETDPIARQAGVTRNHAYALSELNQALEAGIITEEEYEDARARVNEWATSTATDAIRAINADRALTQYLRDGTIPAGFAPSEIPASEIRRQFNSLISGPQDGDAPTAGEPGSVQGEIDSMLPGLSKQDAYATLYGIYGNNIAKLDDLTEQLTLESSPSAQDVEQFLDVRDRLSVMPGGRQFANNTFTGAYNVAAIAMADANIPASKIATLLANADDIDLDTAMQSANEIDISSISGGIDPDWVTFSIRPSESSVRAYRGLYTHSFLKYRSRGTLPSLAAKYAEAEAAKQMQSLYVAVQPYTLKQIVPVTLAVGKEQINLASVLSEGGGQGYFRAAIDRKLETDPGLQDLIDQGLFDVARPNDIFVNFDTAYIDTDGKVKAEVWADQMTGRGWFQTIGGGGPWAEEPFYGKVFEIEIPRTSREAITKLEAMTREERQRQAERREQIAQVNEPLEAAQRGVAIDTGLAPGSQFEGP